MRGPDSSDGAGRFQQEHITAGVDFTVGLDGGEPAPAWRRGQLRTIAACFVDSLTCADHHQVHAFHVEGVLPFQGTNALQPGPMHQCERMEAKGQTTKKARGKSAECLLGPSRRNVYGGTSNRAITENLKGESCL